jgi:hypothetical protein
MIRWNRFRTGLVLAIGASLACATSAQAMPFRAAVDAGASAPKCAHNGVVTNPAGHANCGLHKGATNGDSTSNSGSGTPTDQNPSSSTGDQPSQSDQGDQNDQGDVNDQGDQGSSGSGDNPGSDQGDQNDQGGGSSSDQGNQNN